MQSYILYAFQPFVNIIFLPFLRKKEREKLTIKAVGRDGKPVPYVRIPVYAGNKIFAQNNN